MSLTGVCTADEVRSSWPGSCRWTWRRDGDEHRRSRQKIAASSHVKAVSRRTERTRDDKPVQTLGSGNRPALIRDHPRLSLSSQTASQLTSVASGVSAVNGGALWPVSPKITSGRSSPKGRHLPKRGEDTDRISRIAQLSKSHVERINGGKLDGIATCLCASFGELSYSARPEGRIATTLSHPSAPYSRANSIRLASSSDESWL